METMFEITASFKSKPCTALGRNGKATHLKVHKEKMKAGLQPPSAKQALLNGTEI